MAHTRPLAGSGDRHQRWTAPLIICLAWMAVIAIGVYKLKTNDGSLVAVLTLCPITLTFIVSVLNERRISRLPQTNLPRPSKSQLVPRPAKVASATSGTKAAQGARNGKGVLSRSESSPASDQGGRH